MKYFLLLFLLIFLCSCKNETSKQVSDYKTISIKGGPNNQSIDSAMFRIVINNNSKRFEYKSTKKDNVYFQLFEKETGNDSILKAPDFDCILIDSQFFEFKNEEVKVFLYSYDLPDVVDEEENYYFSDKYGIVLSKSIAWLNTSTLYNQEELKALQDSIMSDLFKFSNPSPTLIKN
ncbi:hypothetical protein [Olleya namhaensis]|uniref:hypothetical protein n=1 Tax=Olleya namhaensis TaxID=1144750 RepID=UPI0024918C73|nr:hypothetical protein [Olleya namhaensis]